MNAVGQWFNWQLHKVLPDPGESFQRIEVDRVILEELKWRPGERVLDVGCYRGRYAAAIADRTGTAVGLDLDCDALSDITDPRVARTCADGAALPFMDRTFDAILCHMTANLFPLPEQAAREFARCTREGGRVILSVCNLAAPYQRVNAALERRWPECEWATLRTSRNHCSAEQWTRVFAEFGMTRTATYSCNLCWPWVHRIRGRWIIPNRVMWGWNSAVRRLSGLPMRTESPHFAAHDYVLVFCKN